MKVVRQTPAELVVHDGAWMTALLGFIFVSAGGGFIALRVLHPEGWSGNGGAWLVYFVGGVFAVVGVVTLILSADRRFVFDRPAHVARVVVQRLAHRQVTEYPFTDIDDVVLERSTGGQSQSPFYRIVFLMKKGGRVPWTPYSTNDQGTLATTAAAVRSFGGWATAEGHAAVAAMPEKRLAPVVHTAATNWGCLAFFLGIFVAVGLGMFTLEVYRVATYRPVQATVIMTDIRTVRGSKGSTYAPLVTYRYSWQGVTYTGAGVTPVSISASMKWATALRDRFQAGKVVTAYVNPGRPASAFLVREVSLVPMLFVLLPVAFGALFAWIIRVQRRQVALVETHLVPVVSA
ncbi:MAG: DUF3592 domain-containing protein [Gemmatimonadales bacterium]